MKKLVLKTTYLSLVIGFVGVASVRANIDYPLEEKADKGNWGGIYDDLIARNFDSLDGLNKHLLIAAAHLSNHNQVAFDLRQKLVPSDWEMVDHWMPNPDGMYMDAGEAVLYAMVEVIHKDYDTAYKYCDRGFSILNADSTETEYSKLYLDDQLYKWLQGVAGIIAFHDLLDTMKEKALPSAYAQVGEMMRLTDTIQKLTKEITDTSLEAALAADTTTKRKDKYDKIIDAMIDDAAEEKRKENAMLVDTLFYRASSLYNSFFYYYKGNTVAMLGNDPASDYYSAATSDPTCHRFWTAYLERQKDVKEIEGVAKRLQERAKNEKSDSNVVFFMNACYTATGKPDKAISELSKYLKKNVGNSIALALRAHAYYEKKDYTNAAADASAAVAADSTNFEGWYVQAVTAQATNDPKAKEYFQKAFDTSPQELLMHAQAVEALKKM